MGEGGRMEGNQWLRHRGVTYEVTQNGFWTVGEEDEKVAFVFLPCFSVTAAISGQKLSDEIMK